MTKACAHEVGTLGITVNALCPGAIETDIMAEAGAQAAESMGMTYQELLDWFAKESATKRLCEVEDVAQVAVLLASDAGARHHRVDDLDRRRHGAVLTEGADMGKLDGKVAAITGGTRSIGRGIADAFVREGASVVVNGRDEAKGQACLEEMGAGDRAAFFAGDASKQDAVEGLVDFTIDHYGQLDIMVLNSGGVLTDRAGGPDDRRGVAASRSTGTSTTCSGGCAGRCST